MKLFWLKTPTVHGLHEIHIIISLKTGLLIQKGYKTIVHYDLPHSLGGGSKVDCRARSFQSPNRYCKKVAFSVLFSPSRGQIAQAIETIQSFRLWDFSSPSETERIIFFYSKLS